MNWKGWQLAMRDRNSEVPAAMTAALQFKPRTSGRAKSFSSSIVADAVSASASERT
jgi:hypothetical protein